MTPHILRTKLHGLHKYCFTAVVLYGYCGFVFLQEKSLQLGMLSANVQVIVSRYGISIDLEGFPSTGTSITELLPT